MIKRTMVHLLALACPLALAQQPAQAPASAREGAPIDLTGYWVAIVNEDWRWRMMTPPKGDYTSVQPLNDAGRAVADQWDPASDGSCKAYGAAGLMRMPTRLHIEWEVDDVLVIHTDAGEQTRRLLFASAHETEPAGRPSLQGRSLAEWVYKLPPAGRRSPAAGRERFESGHLTVETSNLTAGWLRRNGVPYSEQTTMTEHFERFAAPNGDEWLVVTTIVEDPVYLDGPFITSSHFKLEPDGSGWNPQPCRSDT